MISLNMRSQKLVLDEAGHNAWQIITEKKEIPARKAAIVICDMWNKHWSHGATERVNAIAPRMNDVVKAAREKGVLIVHAPSDVIGYYEATPARQRVLAAPPVDPPADLPHDDPPLPVDSSDRGSDTPHMDKAVKGPAWTSQHADIEINHSRDAISDSGRELWNLYRQAGISNILIMGVHTNMCILNRSFGIKQMVKWGLEVALVRDLTDAMYNPAKPPYVNHNEGTRLVVEYIEKFWCPTILSKDLQRVLQNGKRSFWQND